METVVTRLRSSFQEGKPRPLEFRLGQLRQLLRLFEQHGTAIHSALETDLKKSKQESYITEIEFPKNEIRAHLYNLKQWMQPEHGTRTLASFSDRLEIHSEPLGVVLIIGAWNYPFQLTLHPLVGAISAGNCAIVKPSELAPASSALMARLIPQYLDPDCYAIIEGAAKETTQLLQLKFDYIFYTGSTRVGKIVMEAAAKMLTPVTLELGGKSPVYLDDSVNLEAAVKRIMWGKCLNSGQSCIAPDYLLCSRNICDRFVTIAKDVLHEWYSPDDNSIKPYRDYGRIINRQHFMRLQNLLTDANVLLGGSTNETSLYIEPTIVRIIPSSTDHQLEPILLEEIFGPILPIVIVESVDDAISIMNRIDAKPLALYIFSNRNSVRKQILQRTTSGGVCINDTLMHVTNDTLPFGGVGTSGIGAYHGKHSFDTFSHKRTVMTRKISSMAMLLEKAKYPPYNDSKLAFMSMVIKPRRMLIGCNCLKSLFIFALGMATSYGAQQIYRLCISNSASDKHN